MSASTSIEETDRNVGNRKETGSKPGKQESDREEVGNRKKPCGTETDRNISKCKCLGDRS